MFLAERCSATDTLLIQNSNIGLEAVELLTHFGYRFGEDMNEAASNVDMSLPEAQTFRKAWEELRGEFQAFMDLVPLSNPSQLVELAKEVNEFPAKLAALPPFRKRQPKNMQRSRQTQVSKQLRHKWRLNKNARF